MPDDDDDYQVTAYFDESGDQRQERALVIAGYVAPEQSWRTLRRRWTSLLENFGIREFHAVDCEHGRGEFLGMSPRRRQAIHRNFVGLLSGQIEGIIGVFKTVMLEPYTRLRPRFKELRQLPPGLPINGSLDDPYFLAFQLAVETAAVLPAVASLPTHEKIEFVFDRHGRLGGRVKHLFDSIRGDATLGYPARLGDMQMIARAGVPGLQAADLLAYEAYRFSDNRITGESRPPRWQFSQLSKRVAQPGYLDEGALLTLLESWTVS
jgi:hypothetical protein